MNAKEKIDLVLTSLYRIETKGESTMVMAECIKLLASVSQEFAKKTEDQNVKEREG